ncbi:MAG: hypothetical protein ABIG68_11865, partial [Acidobacteriota bacterium]
CGVGECAAAGRFICQAGAKVDTCSPGAGSCGSEPFPITGFYNPDNLAGSPPFFYREGGIWYAFYTTGRNNPDYAATHGSLYACTSSDGLTYTNCALNKSCGNAVSGYNCGYNHVGPRPWVAKIGTNYVMWPTFYTTDIWGYKIYLTQSSIL